MAVAAAAGVLVGLVALSTGPEPSYDTQNVWARPLHRLTPGAYDSSITKADVCDGKAAARPRQVSTAEKVQVERAYGVSPADWHGEIDHLVSREFGGTDVVANLWPEPGTIPNRKDTLEARLRVLVCAGRLTLAQARQAETSDWVVAYHRWVR